MSYKIPESVLVVIHSNDGYVLLLERADRVGFWQSVTGSKDPVDEDLTSTAQREVFEETGIWVGDAPPVDASYQVPASHLLNWQHQEKYTIYPFWRHRYAPGITQNTEYWFGLTVPRSAPIRLSPREHNNYQWLAYQKAAELCFSPSNKAAILLLANQS